MRANTRWFRNCIVVLKLVVLRCESIEYKMSDRYSGNGKLYHSLEKLFKSCWERVKMHSTFTKEPVRRGGGLI